MVKHLHHAFISTSDMGRALAFYRDILGLKLITDTEASGKELDRLFECSGFRARIAIFEEGLEIAQVFYPVGRKSMNVGYSDVGGTILVLEVSDLDKMYSTLVDRGAEFYCPPITVPPPFPGLPSLRVAHVRGPDGERISLMEIPANTRV
jgi:catechol 2,3-dioxygenase-like lactoylglutathione lyase family enzyme